MGREPVFKNISGSTEGPGVIGEIFMGRPACAYAVFQVPAKRIFVLEYVSAVVIRGSIPYPPEYMGDYGAVGYTLAGSDHFHFIPFSRSEPNGALIASQAISIYIPANAQVVVKVPIIPGQSGGASVDVSGYYIAP